MEAVHGLAFDVQLAGLDPAFQQLADALGVFHLLARLAGLQHELPAFPATRGRHVRGGAAVIADELDMVDGLPLAPAGIDDQPVLGVAVAFKFLADQAAHPGAGAIGADQVTGTYAMALAEFAAQPGEHAVVVLLQTFQLPPPAARHVGEAPRLDAQRTFQVGLVEGHQLGVAVEAARSVGAAELADHGAVHAHFGDHYFLEGVFRQAGQLQDTQCLVVEGNGAGHQQDVMDLVDHKGLYAITAEQRS